MKIPGKTFPSYHASCWNFYSTLMRISRLRRESVLPPRRRPTEVKAKRTIQEALARVADYIRNYYDVLIRAKQPHDELNRSHPVSRPTYLQRVELLFHLPSPTKHSRYLDELCATNASHAWFRPSHAGPPFVLSISTSRLTLNDNACLGVSPSAHPAPR